MKTGIHPTYHTITVACACGQSYQVGSTLDHDLRVEICSNCHPLYTGKSKLIDTTGRVDRFKSRQEKAQAFNGSKTASSVSTAEAPAAEVASETAAE